MKGLSDYRRYRFLEMVPGVMVWLTFGLTIAFSFWRPLWVIVFIIIFDTYWLLRVLYLLTYTLLAFRRYWRERRIDWQAQLASQPNWQRIHHVVVLPTVNEDSAVLESTFEGLVHSTYPLGHLIVVLALEEAAGPDSLARADAIRKKYGQRFGHFLVTVHPQGIPGELVGKGSNTAWAGRQVQKLIDSLGLPYEDVVVSSFDIDTVVHPQYFSYLTHKYVTIPNPTRVSFQPIPLFHNNIWDCPAFMRIVSNGTTFWLMSEQLRPERMFTFSSHSMSFRALVDVDFWQNDIVTEDSRIFLQGLLHYDGDYRIEPMYITVSMDAVHGKTLWESITNLYKQQRRWAWGVEHFPYMVWNFRRSTIKWTTRFKYTFTLVEGMYSWATAPILIFVMGHLPLVVADAGVLETAVAQNAPYVLQGLMLAAMVGLLFASIVSVLLLPKRPANRHPARLLIMFGEWILFPISMIIFGSIPAVEAQTRLMLGRYLGFNVTKKFRKTRASSQ